VVENGRPMTTNNTKPNLDPSIFFPSSFLENA